MVVAILGSLSGIIVFLSAVVVVMRGIFKIVNATDENTQAVKDLGEDLRKMSDRINGHEIRIAVLEARRPPGA